MTSIQNNRYLPLSSKNGNPFDDINGVVGPNNASINTTNQIKSIRVIYAEVVDGLTIEYRETEGSTIVQAHGTTADPSGKLDTGLKQEVITLKDTQVIIAVTGMHGATTYSGSLGGRRVAQINFSRCYSISLSHLHCIGSLIATPFSVTADENFVAFGGYTFNQTQNVAHKPTGGLFGLNLHDVAYRRVD
ncbi:hypothetical protein B0H14DRAFT_2882320, partial [Mycena olivaceomarginata]